MISTVYNWVSKQSVDRVFGFVMIMLLVLAAYQVYSHQHLYADGAHFFINLLSEQSIFNPLKSRFFANALQQLLPLLLIKAGITDIELISYAFAINLYLIPIAGILISYTILDTNRKHLILFPVLTILFSVHNNYAFIISEAFVTIAVFWPLLFFVLFTELRTSSSWTFLLSILIFSSTHELAFVLLLLLIIALVVRLKNLGAKHILHTILLALSILMACAINIYWNLYPTNLEFSEDFFQQVGQLVSLKKYPLSAIAIVLVFLRSRYQLQGKWQYVTIGGIGVLLLLVLLPVFNPSGMLYPILHWEQRILVVLGPFILGLVLVLSQFGENSTENLHFPRWSIITLTTVMIIYQLRLTNLWNDFKDDFSLLLLKNSGIIEYRETVIAKNPSEDQFATAWTVPTLGFILHSFSDPEIKSLMSIPDEIWQPWYARDTYGWPHLNYYGIRYRLFGPNIFID